jgi:hypothetical protein
MSTAVFAFLAQKKAALERSAAWRDRWQLPAVEALMASSTYARRDEDNLIQLSTCQRIAAYSTGGDINKCLIQLCRDLSHANGATIDLAYGHPEVYHENVIKSQQAENHVLLEVMALLRKRQLAKRQAA